MRGGAQVVSFIYFFISSYLIDGFMLDTREGVRPCELPIVPHLTNGAFDAGGDRRRPSEGPPDGDASGRLSARVPVSKPPEDDAQVRPGTAESKG